MTVFLGSGIQEVYVSLSERRLREMWNVRLRKDLCLNYIILELYTTEFKLPPLPLRLAYSARYSIT